MSTSQSLPQGPISRPWGSDLSRKSGRQGSREGHDRTSWRRTDLEPPSRETVCRRTREVVEPQHRGGSGDREGPQTGVILRGSHGHWLGRTVKDNSEASRRGPDSDLLPCLCDGSSSGLGKMKWWRCPMTVLSIHSLASGRGDKRACFNFLLGPPHDKGKISPNVIISQKNTLWNHKNRDTE